MTSFEVMLDTNIVSQIMRDPFGRPAQRVVQLGPDKACLSIVVAAELRFGAEKRKSAALSLHVDQVLAGFAVVPFETPVDIHFARLRSHLETRGTPIGPIDMFIAAHALALDLILVTANVREFSRVPGLRVENWLD